jgi:phytanoyl-CoA hydroxylase
MLNQKQLDSFNDNGYLVIEDFIDSDKRESLIDRAAHLIEGFDPNSHRTIFTTDEQERSSDEYFVSSANNVSFFFEKGAIDIDGKFCVPKQQSINKIGHAQHILDPVYKSVIEHLRLDSLSKQLGMDKPRAIQSMHIFKQPRIGGEVGLHQDSTFLYTEPMSCIGFWFALEDASIENGCLQAIPGGHNIALKKRFYMDKDNEAQFEVLDSSDYPEGQLEMLEVKAGTMIILHGQLPHYSDANISPRSRQALSVHIVDGNCHYPKDNWLQTELT